MLESQALGHLYTALKLELDDDSTSRLKAAGRVAAEAILGSFLLAETLNVSAWGREEHAKLLAFSKCQPFSQSRPI
jgi:hypothetical protein